MQKDLFSLLLYFCICIIAVVLIAEGIPKLYLGIPMRTSGYNSRYQGSMAVYEYTTVPLLKTDPNRSY